MLPPASDIQLRFPDLEATTQFGLMLGDMLKSGDVIALNGDLGAGKTTLTQAIANGMGIIGDVTSPTFTLIQEYPGTIPMFHIDPYRLTDPADAYDLGLEDYFDRDGVVVIEWAAKIYEYLPMDMLVISIELPELTSNDEVRTLTMRGIGDRYIELVKSICMRYPEMCVMVTRAIDEF